MNRGSDWLLRILGLMIGLVIGYGSIRLFQFRYTAIMDSGLPDWLKFWLLGR